MWIIAEISYPYCTLIISAPPNEEHYPLGMGVDTVWEREKSKARKRLEKRANSHLSAGCTTGERRSFSFRKETGAPWEGTAKWQT
jgi:hypothetical protein